MKSLALVLAAVGLVACSKNSSNGAPPVPEEVKPFISKTLAKSNGPQPDYKVYALHAGDIKLYLFADHRAIYSAPGNTIKSWWSYSNGVISIADVGDFKIDKGQTSGVLMPNGLPMTMKESWVKNLD